MELSSVSRRRRRIMGFAMMWIVFFHIEIGKEPGFILWFLHRIGFYGVDLFLLVSGLGLWFSLKKDDSVLRFYGRRALRILPAYLVTCCVYYAYKRISAGAFVLSVSTIGYWLQTTHFDWFIPTLVALYLITPLLVSVYKRFERPFLFVLSMLAVSAVLCAVAAFFGLSDLFGSLVRLPVFSIGLWFGDMIDREAAAKESGDLCANGTRVKALPCLALLGFGFAAAYAVNRFMKGALVQAGLNAYPALLVVPALAIVLGFIFDFISAKCGIVGKMLLSPFDFFGRYSLEIYLLHERIQELRPGLGVFKTLLITLVGAVVLHEAIDALIRLFRKAASEKAA